MESGAHDKSMAISSLVKELKAGTISKAELFDRLSLLQRGKGEGRDRESNKEKSYGGSEAETTPRYVGSLAGRDIPPPSHACTLTPHPSARMLDEEFRTKNKVYWDHQFITACMWVTQHRLQLVCCWRAWLHATYCS
jgi:hypothetical protein